MSAPLTLYAIGDELERVKEMLYAAEGELTPEIEEALNAVELSFSEKAERVALYCRELLSSSKAVDEEAARLSARAKGYMSAAENLKGYLQAQMERAELMKVEGKLVTVRLQKSQPSVVAPAFTQDELDTISPVFVRVVPEIRTLDKKAVLTHWKGTGTSGIPGVEVVQSLHLRIV